MGSQWDNKIEISLADTNYVSVGEFDKMLDEASQHSPDLVTVNAALSIAETVIKNKRNNRKDTVDLVGFLGNRLSTGSSETLSEPIVGVRVEYKNNMDKSGQDAELSQAFLDRSIALQQREEIRELLHYQIASLMAEINVGKAAYDAALVSVNSEKAKLADAEERYRKGRIEIDRLIQFESELNESRLSLDLRQVELERRQYKLALLRGIVWQQMELPHYEWHESVSASSEAQ
jgi:outer membrane protein TolC